MDETNSLEILSCSRIHPDPIHPHRGLFNRRALQQLAAEPDISLGVLSPRPVSPPLGPYAALSDIPARVEWDAYTVDHPRFLYPLPKRLFKYSVAARSFRRCVSKHLESKSDVPDLVHAMHIFFDGYGVTRYCERNDIPFVVTAHGQSLNEFSSYSARTRQKIRKTLRQCEQVLCVSDELASIATTIIPEYKVKTVSIGADPTQFPLSERRRLRRERSLADETVVLYCGQFVDRKGIDIVIESLPELDLENSVLVLVGHGGEKLTELRNATTDLQNRDRVQIFEGLPTSELREWFAIADLLVLPSRSEGRPTVVYEAMASETAVLASRVGGISEQVSDGCTGILIKPGDATAFIRKYNELVTQRQRLEEMGRCGLERLESEGWTWSGYTTRVREIYSEVLSEK